MNKKAIATIATLLSLSMLAGCAKPSAEAAAPAETPSAEEGAYTYESSIVVDGGRELSLLLHGIKLDGERYGIREIEVLSEGTPIQTISVSEAGAAEATGAYQPLDATECWTEDGGLCAVDMNFDGAQDIGIIGWVTAGANIPYYYWLWNAASQRFEYAFCLCDPYPDEAAQQIISATSQGADCYIVDHYEYAKNGIGSPTLLLVKREVQLMAEDEAASAALFALISEIAENYHPGTAGCSLTSAEYAEELLDWYAKAQPAFSLMTAVAARFYWALEPGAAELFAEQLWDIYQAARTLDDDDPAQLLQSAGYDAELLFGGLYSGMGMAIPAE